MKIVMLGDLHGNLPATLAMEKMLEQIQPDEIWFLGDAVGKGPSNAETCDWVRSHCTLCVGGNWDYGIGGKEFPEDGYFWNQLGEERMHWLNTLPREQEVLLSGIRFRLFHGRPVTPLMQVQDAFAFSAAFECEIPGAKKIECGNYLEHDLAGAKAEAAAYCQVLAGCTPETMVYPE